jgi:hypothetical protein
VSDDADRPRAVDDDAEAVYREAAGDLADALDDTVRDWIVRILNGRLPTEWPAARRDRVQPAIAAVAEQIHAEVVPRLRALLATDVSRQSAGPLGVLRGCVGPANALLDELGVTRPDRDPVAVSMFPDDPHDLGPANFDDIDPSLHDIGLVWGAAKAHVVLTRHRR